MELVIALGFLAVTLAIAIRPLQPRIKNLRLGKEDVLLVRYQGRLGLEAAGRIRDALAAAIPGARVLVLDCGLDLEVLHRDQIRDDDAGEGDAGGKQHAPLAHQEVEQGVGRA